MIPLSLYIHIPWCLRKCPYCDFSSIAIQKEQLPERDYINALLHDLENDLQTMDSPRPLQSIFIGGGTPSLLSPDGIDYLLGKIKKLFGLCSYSSENNSGSRAHAIVCSAAKSAGYLYDFLQPRARRGALRAPCSIERYFEAEGHMQCAPTNCAFVKAVRNSYEITLEMNPGTVIREQLLGFRQAGINRLSIGVQSFDNNQLSILQRLHTVQQAKDTIQWAQEIGFSEINLDLMHGLPNQTIEEALNDLKIAIAFNPPHLSWYALTIEENTPFGKNPPSLPSEDEIVSMQQQGEILLQEAGYNHYEISAYAKPGHECRHNLNYWTFGDYIGIGAGAHGKLTHLNPFTITRTAKIKDPMNYLNASNYIEEKRIVASSELSLEFMMNALRLNEGFSLELFEERTHLPFSILEPILKRLSEKNLLIQDNNVIRLSSLGKRFLNEVLLEFVE